MPLDQSKQATNQTLLFYIITYKVYVLKLKKAQNELANIYLKEQPEYIHNQIDKTRDSEEDRQSRIAWQRINEVNRRKSTAKAKLNTTNQQERTKPWKQHFENLLGNPPKVTHEPITRIIGKHQTGTVYSRRTRLST